MNLGNVNFGENYSTYDMKLTLLTISDEWLADISKNFIDSMELKLTETSSITLTIPRYVVRNKKKVEYDSYDLFSDNRIISLNESHKFIIRNIDISEGLSGHYKKFTAYSLESTLQRIPAIIEDATRQLRKDDVNRGDGYLDLFKEQCYGWDWTCSESAYIEHINGGTSNKYRWISVGDSNFLEATRQTVADAFNVVPIFDSYNKILHIVTEEELDNHSGLFLDFGNYLKSTSKNTSRDKSCTQLKVVSDKTSISSVNLNGSEIIEYYSDEIRSKMSIELRNALSEYDAIANEQNLIFITKKSELTEIERDISNKEIELIDLEEEYKVLDIKRKQYIIDNNSAGLSSNYSLITASSQRVENKKSEIEVLKTAKTNIENIMQQIAVKLNKKTCTNNSGQLIFNKQTLSQLFLFTQSDTYQNDTAYTPYALLNDATTELKKRQEGITEFTIDELTNNFVFGVKRKDGRKWNEVMELGSLITVTTKENGEKDLRLVGYTVTPPSNEKGTAPQLTLILSDRTFIWSDVRFNTSSKKSQNASNGIFNGKTKWDDYKEGVDTANSIRMNGLQLATARVTGRTNNNAVTLDGYGMMFENTDTKVDQLYIGSNLLCFSDDGWKTSKTALDKYGLIASTLAGELLIGERLVIENENGFFRINKDGAFFKGNTFLIEGSDGKTLDINSKFQITNNSISAGVTDAINHTNAQVVILNKSITAGVTDSKNHTNSQFKILSDSISTKVTAGDVKSFVEQTPSSLNIGFNKISNRFQFSNSGLKLLNDQGIVSMEADANGDFSYTGRLQPRDNIIKLFGENCRVDGSNNNIRLQWDNENYCYIGTNVFRLFNSNSLRTGVLAPSFYVMDDGNFRILCTGTNLKMLRGSAEIQCRDQNDNNYGRFVGSDFVNGSKREFKENIEDPDDIDFISILMNNHIKKYNLKSDIEVVEKMPTVIMRDGTNSIRVDTKLGLILEDLTVDGGRVLNPMNSEGISQYSMNSVLWLTSQEHQKTLEAQANLIVEQQKQLDSQEARLRVLESLILK